MTSVSGELLCIPLTLSPVSETLSPLFLFFGIFQLVIDCSLTSTPLHPGVHMGTGEFNAGGNPAMDKHPIQGEVVIPLVASLYRNQIWPHGPLDSCADFTFTLAFLPAAL